MIRLFIVVSTFLVVASVVYSIALLRPAFAAPGDMVAVSAASAPDGFVQCGNNGQPSCQFCHLVSMIDRIIEWLAMVLTILASILFAVAGMRLVISAGNTQAKLEAKKSIINVATGLMIVLAAWMIIDFVLQTLVDGPFTGAWNTIQCFE